MNKRIAKVLTALLLCMVFVSQSVVMTQAVTFQNTYNNNFSDVSKDSWYYGSVAEAYSLGIINGVSATSFSPDGTLTLAECIKIASCVHQLINTGSVTLTNGSPNWYDSYVSYALQNNIITETYDNYSQYASRATVAVLFARVLPAETEWVNYLDGDNFPL